MGFFEKFESEWGPKLGKRQNTFLRIFQFLKEKRKDAYTIMETGCARIAGNWGGDGQSTILFDAFVNEFGGNVFSVDLSEQACVNARSLVGKNTTVAQGDSVAFLHRMAAEFGRTRREIDLLYLDSYDVDFRNPYPSAAHHLKELCAISPVLSPGTLVVVDDATRLVAAWRGEGTTHIVQDLGLSGKAMYVAEYFQQIGVRPYFEGYQYGWVISG